MYRYGINHSFAFDAVAFQPHLAASFVCAYFTHVLIGRSPWDRARRMVLRRAADLAEHATVLFMGRPTSTDAFRVERWVWASMKSRPWGVTLPFYCGSVDDGKNELGDARPNARPGKNGQFCTTLQPYKRTGQFVADNLTADSAEYRCKWSNCRASVVIKKPSYFDPARVITKDEDGFWFWYALSY